MNSTPFDNMRESYPGWAYIISTLEVELSQYPYQLLQIKEKFGCLRVYANSQYYQSQINQIIERAEILSSMTCWKCGDKGTIRNCNGWYMAVCDEHSKS